MNWWFLLANGLPWKFLFQCFVLEYSIASWCHWLFYLMITIEQLVDWLSSVCQVHIMNFTHQWGYPEKSFPYQKKSLSEVLSSKNKKFYWYTLFNLYYLLIFCLNFLLTKVLLEFLSWAEAQYELDIVFVLEAVSWAWILIFEFHYFNSFFIISSSMSCSLFRCSNE